MEAQETESEKKTEPEKEMEVEEQPEKEEQMEVSEKKTDVEEQPEKEEQTEAQPEKEKQTEAESEHEKDGDVDEKQEQEKEQEQGQGQQVADTSADEATNMDVDLPANEAANSAGISTATTSESGSVGNAGGSKAGAAVVTADSDSSGLNVDPGAAEPSAAPSPPTSALFVGMIVQVRDHGKPFWLEGYVTSVEPLQVTASLNKGPSGPGYSWDEVRLLPAEQRALLEAKGLVVAPRPVAWSVHGLVPVLLEIVDPNDDSRRFREYLTWDKNPGNRYTALECAKTICADRQLPSVMIDAVRAAIQVQSDRAIFHNPDNCEGEHVVVIRLDMELMCDVEEEEDDGRGLPGAREHHVRRRQVPCHFTDQIEWDINSYARHTQLLPSTGS
jgi:hypothetical protein